MIDVAYINGLFDDEVYVLTAAVDAEANASLTPSEAAHVAKAVLKRRQEYATGRYLARLALERHFAINAFDLLASASRAPLWPDGISGSISHCNTRAWVALAQAGGGSLGIDGEDRKTLDPDLWRMVFTRAERTALSTLDPGLRGQRALVMFSAKEALYKAQFPQSGCFMGFEDAEITLEEGGRFLACFKKSVGPFPEGLTVSGQWRQDEFTLTAIRLPAGSGG